MASGAQGVMSATDEFGLMEPKAKAALLFALRSGKYKQGGGCLRTNDDNFCCLGVLCDLGKDRQEKWFQRSPNGDFYYGHGKDHDGDTAHLFPPVSVARKAGLSISATEKLALQNDSGKTFNEIANWIEENL